MIRSAVVVGAGFGGLAAAIALQGEGIEDITILERGDAIGGVWHHNTYPGAACDVPSHLYSYSFEPNPDWRRRFAGQAEIQRYLQRTAERRGLAGRVRLGVEVTGAVWLEQEREWLLQSSAGDLRAQMLVAACGQLTRPAIPHIEGIESFAGPAFHSSRWRHELDMSGLRVAVVGTGASAIQLVPQLAHTAASVTVVQRTAPWILPKFDRAYRPLANTAFQRYPALQRAGRLGWWTFLEAAIAGFVGAGSLLAPLELVGRAHLRRQVHDPALRALLTPGYAIGCKRILISNDWYPALARENVELIAESPTHASAGALHFARAGERELDVIVYGTGFRAREFVAPMQVSGRDGASLQDLWQGLPSAWHGLSVPGFPNMFLMYGPNTFGGSGSAVYMIESGARHLAAAVRAMRAQDAAVIEVRRDAYESFIAELRERQRRTIWATGGCSSWYLDEQGRDPTNWPGYTIEYRRRTASIDERSVYSIER